MKKPFNQHDLEQIDTASAPFVFVDYLSFSFQYVDLRHAHKSDLSSMLWSPMPSYKDELQAKLAKNPEQKEKLERRFQQKFNVALEERLIVFCLHVLGLRMSPWRNKGLNGYEDSCHLQPLKSREHVGFVALGGNNDTCFIQIEGEGCKHLFAHTDTFRLHWWLTEILGVTRLSRIDLAVDDFNNLFNRVYARKAFYDDAFKTSLFGRSPNGGERLIKEPNGKVVNESFEVGSRSSTVYWRIYNKAAQLKLDIDWFRSEVELKKVSIDVLKNISGYFAGICVYSASIISSSSFKVTSIKKKASIDMHSRVMWLRRQCGKSLYDLALIFNGDLEKTFGMLLPAIGVDDESYGKIVVPDTYKLILDEILKGD